MNAQQQRLCQYLKENGRSSTKEIRNQLGIEHPSTIVSRIRAIFGEDCIKGIWTNGKNRFGESTRFKMYELSTEGRDKIFPVKKVFPAWITGLTPQTNN